MTSAGITPNVTSIGPLDKPAIDGSRRVKTRRPRELTEPIATDTTWICPACGRTTTSAADQARHVAVELNEANKRRHLISERTREALAELKAAGVRLGAPQQLPDEIVARIVNERAAGASLRAIADRLASDGVPTARGGPTWHASAVAAVIRSQAGQRLSGDLNAAIDERPESSRSQATGPPTRRDPMNHDINNHGGPDIRWSGRVFSGSVSEGQA